MVHSSYINIDITSLHKVSKFQEEKESFRGILASSVPIQKLMNCTGLTFKTLPHSGEITIKSFLRAGDVSGQLVSNDQSMKNQIEGCSRKWKWGQAHTGLSQI